MNDYLFDTLATYQLQTQEDVAQYHAQNLFGHSKIVNFEHYGPRALCPDFEISKSEAMIFGSLVDTLLTRPKSFANEFYVPIKLKKLTPSETKIVEYITENATNNPVISEFLYSTQPSLDPELISIMNDADFYSSRKDEKRLEALFKLQPLMQELQNNKHRQFISQEQCVAATNCVNAIKDSEITKSIFQNTDRLLTQVAIYTPHFHIKALFDILYFDYDTKTIHPIDLKTISYPEREFISKAFYRFGYYRQAELYTKVLETYLYENSISDWKIADFKFLTICKDTLSPTLYSFPIIYDSNNNLIISNTKTVVPYHKLVSDMLWHIQNQQFQYSRQTYLELFKNKSNNENTLVTIPILNLQTQDNNTTDDSDNVATEDIISLLF